MEPHIPVCTLHPSQAPQSSLLRQGGCCVGLGVLDGISVGVLVDVSVGVLLGAWVGVLVAVLVGVWVGVLVRVGVEVGVDETQTPPEQTLGSWQHSPFSQKRAIGGNPPARVLVGQQSSSP
ncbi:MAG: hypothetical protein KC438_07945 [Thermomicrobiales bacterium]|nr:hypothetical protein [Thermomicrobiales bacterium]MCO5221488.1 hypothetical protein [Thermomicrobiales bacterium]